MFASEFPRRRDPIQPPLVGQVRYIEKEMTDFEA
jgi:hypothetical protein